MILLLSAVLSISQMVQAIISATIQCHNICWEASIKQIYQERFGLTATGNSGDSYSPNRMELAEWKWTTEVGRSVLVDVAFEDMGHAAEQTLATHVSVIQLCTPTSPENVSGFGLLLVFPFHWECQKEQHISVALDHVRLQ